MANDKKSEAPTAEVTTTPEERMAKTIADGIATGMAAAAQIQANAAAAARGPALKPKMGCGICRQDISGCNNEHRLLAVYPRSKKYGRFFQGVIINGVRYLSNHRGHKIWVPKDCNIEHVMEMWENNEDDQSQGKEVEHDSGVLSATGKSDVKVAGGEGSSFR